MRRACASLTAFEERAVTTTIDHEYRHRTPDLWEASALWALGYSPSHTEIIGDRVVLVFPTAGDGLVDAVQSYRTGTAMVNALAIKQGYYHVRGLIRAGVNDDARS